MEKLIIQENSGIFLGQSVPHGDWTDFDTGFEWLQGDRTASTTPVVAAAWLSGYCMALSISVSSSTPSPLLYAAPGGPVVGHLQLWTGAQYRMHKACECAVCGNTVLRPRFKAWCVRLTIRRGTTCSLGPIMPIWVRAETWVGIYNMKIRGSLQ